MVTIILVFLLLALGTKIAKMLATWNLWQILYVGDKIKMMATSFWCFLLQHLTPTSLLTKKVLCVDPWTKGLIFGIISIAIVLLGWISLYKDFESEDQDFYFLLFQGYIGLTIFEAVVKVSQNHAYEVNKKFFRQSFESCIGQRFLVGDVAAWYSFSLQVFWLNSSQIW